MANESAPKGVILLPKHDQNRIPSIGPEGAAGFPEEQLPVLVHFTF